MVKCSWCLLDTTGESLRHLRSYFTWHTICFRILIILIEYIAPTRWKLRKAVKRVTEVLAILKVDKHPDKTFIGKASRGFDFLGYFITPWGVSVAEKTIQNMKGRIARLYEQGAKLSIGQYVCRWVQSVFAGLKEIRVKIILFMIPDKVSFILSRTHHFPSRSVFPLFDGFAALRDSAPSKWQKGWINQ